VSPELCLLADGQQIEQVLINLIQNAVENTERGGTITLRAENRQPHPPSGTTAATVLEVADTGTGIPPETAVRIFEPFFSTKKNGTGLGLSIAARIVEAHDGVLQYRTQPGHGTTFSIILPNTGANAYDTQAQTIGNRR
jgi:signal transduction histidine kinase